jgi:putative ABC transport system substrate-binding protein
VPGATFAAKRATVSIPIVMMNTPDPVHLRLVASLSRPGGNITGTTTLSADLCVKQLELLKPAAPSAQRIAVLWNPTNPWHPIAVKGIEQGAPSLSVRLDLLQVAGPGDFDGAFDRIAAQQDHALLVLVRLAELSSNRRIPSMFGLREHVQVGGLMSYWAHGPELYRRVATYLDRIFKGAKPGDSPIEQASRFDLVINLRTARLLNVRIPESLLLRADEVIR